MSLPLMTQAEARRLILAEWRKWPKLSNPPGSNDMFAFYRRLKNEQPELLSFRCREDKWPAAGFEDTELGVLMEPEVGHGTTEVYAGVQA